MTLTSTQASQLYVFHDTGNEQNTNEILPMKDLLPSRPLACVEGETVKSHEPVFTKKHKRKSKKLRKIKKLKETVRILETLLNEGSGNAQTNSFDPNNARVVVGSGDVNPNDTLTSFVHEINGQPAATYDRSIVEEVERAIREKFLGKFQYEHVLYDVEKGGWQKENFFIRSALKEKRKCGCGCS